ncbi:bifunctional histidinol-phosphatase/imidazoleglycerol-phosphate dehydratase HisB [Candidatus Azobacteroides pseudotrichonymphae]|uniref:Histidine biosynthesis bifunctional protein HisB n=1 Tax=Azobacteroides pseudotrichonymphae genomovar. CFP2 TaxID=511995 RepID=B6YQ24_AZOPC|nr:bifunctional histidinol-phosphatase/imidazoleglycerol-phosphate dehydratase HisB [Candidatus Azobacteroides pseudotrichonymphae]BAG83296.1 histidinol-phosphatase/imidazoleglycerol-phosphate dehydratase [Candidatus Azobacteroides pseudotrichonymphae genomovar. CFP2]
MKKRVLFIDRDGTLIIEPPITFQVNNLEELEFLPGVIRNLYFIRKHLNFELVMVTNQDGLGTPIYPQNNFDIVQKKMLNIFQNEGIFFDNIFIDKSFPQDNLSTRKPNTAMLTQYFSDDYDLRSSYVIGDRLTDIELAKNLGCKAILLSPKTNFIPNTALITINWDKISEFLVVGERKAIVQRTTKETNIHVEINIDGKGKTDISTGLGFFNHLLAQIGKHSGIDLIVKMKGDLNVDEHHTIEDTGIALGSALSQVLTDKRGIERYGFCLPMDDCLCLAAVDFGGRAWFVWETEFHREKIGDMPTEMFPHFFKSLSDAAKINLIIKAKGQNEHHKIEGIFKSFARAIKMAIRRDIFNYELPSTKGIL